MQLQLWLKKILVLGSIFSMSSCSCLDKVMTRMSKYFSWLWRFFIVSGKIFR